MSIHPSVFIRIHQAPLSSYTQTSGLEPEVDDAPLVVIGFLAFGLLRI
jgi:hypothetical protein